MQTKRQSVVEVTTNTFVGMAGSWAICYACLRFLKDPVLVASVQVAVCTVWSLARGYYIRRRFAAKERT